MTLDPAATAWETMLTDANGTPPAINRSSALGGHGMVALRTTGLLILAALAILVLLPALAAQAAFAG